jgi:hypothetical protein
MCVRFVTVVECCFAAVLEEQYKVEIVIKHMAVYVCRLNNCPGPLVIGTRYEVGMALGPVWFGMLGTRQMLDLDGPSHGSGPRCQKQKSISRLGYLEPHRLVGSSHLLAPTILVPLLGDFLTVLSAVLHL